MNVDDENTLFNTLSSHKIDFKKDKMIFLFSELLDFVNDKIRVSVNEQNLILTELISFSSFIEINL